MNKRLYRSRTDRMIAGVCGGLGEYFNIDPVIIRLVFAFSFFMGAGLFAYIVLWIVVPEEGETKNSKLKIHNKEDRRGSFLGGLLLIAIGLAFLFRGFFTPFFGMMSFGGMMNALPNMMTFWPLIIVIVGVVVLLRSAGNGKK